MHSVLTITTPAGNLTLLAPVELRAAVGLAESDQSQDAKLLMLEARVAAAIMSECNIAIGAGGEPTLKQETLTETFRSVDVEQMVLARRHGVTITSIVEDAVTLVANDYVVDPEAGMLIRLCSDIPTRWCASKIVIVYKAGFTTIPGDLKQAAMDFLSAAYRESGRDPFVKSEEIEIPDVERTRRDYWVGSIPGQSNEGAVPDIVSGQLKRFRNIAVC